MDKQFAVRQPKLNLCVGIIGMLFFGALIVLMSIFPNDTAQWWVYLLFSLFVVLGAFLTVYNLFWNIIVKNEIISCHSLLKRTKTFTFDAIKEVKMKYHDIDNKRHYNGIVYEIILYSDKSKLIAVDSACKNFDVFVSCLVARKIINGN